MKNRTFRDTFVEIFVPFFLFMWVMPQVAGDIWQNVEADPTTQWYEIVTMHVIMIMIGVCWIQAYNCIRLGVFPPTRRR